MVITKVEEECDKCGGESFIPRGCCSGYECGCMGMPTDFKFCDSCNADGSKAPSFELVVEWPWFFLGDPIFSEFREAMKDIPFNESYEARVKYLNGRKDEIIKHIENLKIEHEKHKAKSKSKA